MLGLNPTLTLRYVLTQRVLVPSMLEAIVDDLLQAAALGL